MPVVIPECPICHARASLADRQPYCPKCGWNRDVAITTLRRSLKMLPVGVVVFSGFMLFMVFGWHFRNAAQIAIMLAVPVIGLMLNYFVLKNRLAKLQAMPPAVSSPAPDSGHGFSESGATPADNAPKPDPQCEALLLVPRPRQIRMARRGQLNLAIGLLIVSVFAAFLGVYFYNLAARSQSFHQFGPKDWLMAGLAVLILLIPYGMWRSQVRERDLLQNGEIALGRVTRQWYNKNTSSIAYEFTDFMGNTHTGMGFDYTKKVYQGMSVPVFYDTNKPTRQIAYCATLHEIALENPINASQQV